jgi:lipopolysaccharide transport system ATP-binding protein
MSSVISITNLGKKYKLNRGRNRETFREKLSRIAKNPVKTIKDIYGPHEEFWALKGFNLEVERGEVIGVIGPNGAGKSTLLKLLSRITVPTAGQIVLKGRTASLLEVGTGFHPELTGRENIYLNGAILGMSKQEIEEKFERIVDFSGVSKFLNTPVKRYSSGMSVRLAFAVAAHLDPEILLIDEVLAVGDAEFQKKCLGKMNEVSRTKGRTILFVSHNMQLIQNLCSRTIWLEEGRINEIGPTMEVVDNYLAKLDNRVRLSERQDRQGKGKITLTEICVRNSNNNDSIKSGDCLKLKISYRSRGQEILKDTKLSVLINNHLNFPLLRLSTDLTREKITELKPRGEVVCVTGPVNLGPGQYNINVAIFLGNEKQDHIINATSFEIKGNQDEMQLETAAINKIDTILVPHRFYQKE